MLNRTEVALFLAAAEDLDFVPLVENDLGGEIANDERDRLSVVAVGRLVCE
jgi:hypothetical protein